MKTKIIKVCHSDAVELDVGKLCLALLRLNPLLSYLNSVFNLKVKQEVGPIKRFVDWAYLKSKVSRMYKDLCLLKISNCSFRGIPFYPKLAEKIRRCLSYHNACEAVLKPRKTNGKKLASLKDSVDPIMLQRPIYQIPCLDQGLREKIFQEVRRSIPGPQILLGPQALSGLPSSNHFLSDGCKSSFKNKGITMFAYSYDL